MSRVSVRSIFLSLLVAVVIAGALGVWWFLVNIRPLSDETDKRMVVVEEGLGVIGVGRLLASGGVIRSARAFQLYALIEGLDGSLQVGTYFFAPSYSIEDIATILARGDVETNETSVTFLEGWTMQGMGDALGDKDILSASVFVEAASVHDSRAIIPGEPYTFLVSKPSDQGLEGYLFPDTYRIFRDTTAPAVIQKMLANFDLKVDDGLRAAIDASGRTMHEIVTMASILEKEVRTDEDRRLASDLFWRRIEAGIPMQSDATVNYVTGKSALQPTIDDTEVDSPYNTYVYPGLPPSPINNPGLAAIQSAANPQVNDYWYYLNAPSGETIFSKTFEEHKANKIKYLQ